MDHTLFLRVFVLLYSPFFYHQSCGHLKTFARDLSGFAKFPFTLILFAYLQVKNVGTFFTNEEDISTSNLLENHLNYNIENKSKTFLD